MNIVAGNFLQGLQDPNGIVVAPTNGVLTAKGLVMGAGAARALADHCPSLPNLFLKEIHTRTTRVSTYWQYGFVPVTTPTHRYGAFQTKLDFRTPAIPSLVQHSAETLAQYLQENPYHVHLAFPGVGLGQMKQSAVQQILEDCLQPHLHRLTLYLLPQGAPHDAPPLVARPAPGH